jgi:copper chaperone
MMSQVTFNIPSISCGHCVRTIRAALGEVAGVQQVEVDIDAKQVAVVYDATVVGEAQMRDVLAEADYPVVETDAAQPEGLTLVEAGASCGCCRI